MPTIDDLGPATSASDSDEFMVSQAGITRKITRSLVLNGLQPQLAVPAGALVGRVSAGTGAPEAVAIGQNLVLTGGTLSASAAPFLIAGLPAGSVPSANDLIAVAQAGTNAAVSYGQLVSGLASSANLDVSRASVTPTGARAPQRLADLAANALTQSGGSVTGWLYLAADPIAANQASTKNYVDLQVSPTLRRAGGSMSGMLTLASVPRSPLDAATKSYVDTAVGQALPLSGGTLSGSVTLGSDPTVPAQAATKRYADTKVARSGDTLAGSLTLAADPASPLQAATKNYVDSMAGRYVAKSGRYLDRCPDARVRPDARRTGRNEAVRRSTVAARRRDATGGLTLATDPSLPSHAATKNYVDKGIALFVTRSDATMSGPLTLAADPSAALQAATKQYVDLRVSRNGDTMTGMLALVGDPVAPLQASTKGYVDAKLAGSFTRAGGTLTGALVLAGDPTLQLQASTQTIRRPKIARAGDTLTGALILASDPVLSAQAATKRYVDIQANANLPLAGGSMSGFLALSADPTGPLHAASKRYVDGQAATALPLAGGTVIGAVSLATAPTAAQHAATKQYVDTQVGLALPKSGGTVTGTLSLLGVPSSPLHAATKAYVDANPNQAGVLNVARAPFGAALNGTTDDTAAFKAAYLAAPAGGTIYVPNGTTVLQQPGTWGVALTKLVKWVVDGTILADGTPLAAAVPTGGGPASLVLPGIATGSTRSGLTSSQGGSQATDFAVSQSSYIVNHNGGQNGAVASNVRSDTIIYASPGIIFGAALTGCCGAARKHRMPAPRRSMSDVTFKRSDKTQQRHRTDRPCRSRNFGQPALNTGTRQEAV